MAGKAITWSVFIRPHISLRQRLKGHTHETQVQQLGLQVLAALTQEGIDPAHVEA
jgi:hypothetical protein